MFKKERSSPLKVEREEQRFTQLDPPENLNSGVILVEGSMVDVNYKGRSLTGVVLKKMEEEDRYLVFIDDLVDIFELERKHFRVRGEVKELGKSLFSSGTLVEVRHRIGSSEVSWVPAMIVKESVESGQKIIMFRFCNKVFRFKDVTTKKKTAEFYRFRPTPPPLEVDEYNLLDCVEMFYGSGWCRGIVIKVLSEKCYVVSLKATNENLTVKHMDLRPSMVWEDGVWHNRSVLGSGNSKDGRRKRKREETYKLGLSETPGSPCNGSKVCDKGKSIFIDYEDVDVDDEPLSAKLTSYESPNVVNGFTAAVMETTTAKGSASPFEKTSPYWKTFETNDLYNRIPQTPHFSPLFNVNEDIREMSAIGMMETFYALLKEVKSLQLDVSSDKLNGLSSSLAKLEKHGFNVSNQQSRLSKVLFLQTERAKKADKRKFLEEKLEVNKMIKQNVEEEMTEFERKIMELKRQELVAKEKKDAVDKRMVEIKSCAEGVDQEIEELELEFQATVSAEW